MHFVLLVCFVIVQILASLCTFTTVKVLTLCGAHHSTWLALSTCVKYSVVGTVHVMMII